MPESLFNKVTGLRSATEHLRATAFINAKRLIMSYVVNIHNRNLFSLRDAEADLGSIKLVVMNNVFFKCHQHKIEIKRLICVK